MPFEAREESFLGFWNILRSLEQIFSPKSKQITKYQFLEQFQLTGPQIK